MMLTDRIQGEHGLCVMPDFVMEVGNCHLNCMEAVERYGGEVIGGWIVSKDFRALVGKNIYAQTELVGHSVWKYDGVLYETVPEYANRKVIIDTDIPWGCQHNINFSDYEGLASSPLENVYFKLVKIVS